MQSLNCCAIERRIARVRFDVIRHRNHHHMNQDALKALLEKQASGYEEQQKKTVRFYRAGFVHA